MVKKEYRSETTITKLDARHRRIEPGAVVKSRKGSSDAGRTDICFQWKERRPMFEERPMQFPA